MKVLVLNSPLKSSKSMYSDWLRAAMSAAGNNEGLDDGGGADGADVSENSPPTVTVSNVIPSLLKPPSTANFPPKMPIDPVIVAWFAIM